MLFHSLLPEKEHLLGNHNETLLCLGVASVAVWLFLKEVHAFSFVVTCRFESAVSSYRSCLRSYMAMDSQFEDARETPSPSPSPFSSPAHSLTRNGGGTQRVTLLSKNQDLSPNSQHEANIVNFMVRQVSAFYMNVVFIDA